MKRAGSESEGPRAGGDRWRIVLLIAVAIFAVVLALLASDRGVFNYHTETDYVGSFAVEAGRLLRGEPLRISFHPPWYPVVLATAFTFVGDWFAVGTGVSVLASVITVLAAAALWRRALGVAASIGAAAALMASPIYISFSAQATSDVFSHALHTVALLATWVGARRRTVPTGLLAGLVIGLALLTRTNNVVLFALLSFYLVPVTALAPADRADEPAVRPTRGLARFTGLAAAVVGIALPLLAWAAFANATGAPVIPTKTHENLALTYFSAGNDRISGDARLEAAAGFTSSLDVVLSDPLHIARTYARDLVTSSFVLLARNSLLPFPLIAVGALAFVVVWWQRRDRRLALTLLLGNLALMYLLTNAKAFEHRYYFFLLPLVGAAIGAVLAPLLGPRSRPASRAFGWLSLIAAAGIAVAFTVAETPRRYGSDWSTDAAAAASFLRDAGLPTAEVVFAYKPHLAFYLEARDGRTLPRSADVDALMGDLRAVPHEGTGAAYLFFGTTERRARPQLMSLADAAGPVPDGLTRVAQGDERGGWVLYRIEDPPRPDAEPGPP